MSAPALTAERGSITDLAIVRLADEGVPIRALVRVFHKAFGDVEEILREAQDDGRIVAMPAADWPAGTERGSRVPTAAPERGDVPEWFVVAAKLTFGLTMQEARLVALIAWKGRASKSVLHLTVSPDAEPKIVDVLVCKCRQKLAPSGITIGTVWGWGYELSSHDRKALRDLITAEPAEAAEDAA